MDRIEEFDIINTAVKTFGAETQIDKAIEECGELIRALSRYKHPDVYDPVVVEENLLEEMADVGIMLDQLRIIAGASEEEQREAKLLRLKQYMEERA